MMTYASHGPKSVFGCARVINRAPSGMLQRKCACGGTPGPTGECEACRTKRLQRKRKTAAIENQNEPEVPPIVHEVLRSPGQPLDTETRAFMELRFGHDFSNVRVHTDAKATESARAVNALAYTVGKRIVFGGGQYAPETFPGRQLLAHELTHTIQQSRGRPLGTPPLRMATSESVETNADRVADSVAAGREVTALTDHQAVSLARQHAGRLEPVPTYATATLRQSKPGGCVGGQWITEYDGCSLPAMLASAFGIDPDNPGGGKNTQFALSQPSAVTDRACDRHDECYQTCHGGNLPQAQAACDERMYSDMYKTCSANSENHSIKEKCLAWAFRYYKGLRAFGFSAFLDRQSEVCACNNKKGKNAKRFDRAK
jgi:Domain of unknown function (DUF4157)